MYWIFIHYLVAIYALSIYSCIGVLICWSIDLYLHIDLLYCIYICNIQIWGKGFPLSMIDLAPAPCLILVGFIQKRHLLKPVSIREGYGIYPKPWEDCQNCPKKSQALRNICNTLWTYPMKVLATLHKELVLWVFHRWIYHDPSPSKLYPVCILKDLPNRLKVKFAGETHPIGLNPSSSPCGVPSRGYSYAIPPCTEGTCEHQDHLRR